MSALASPLPKGVKRQYPAPAWALEQSDTNSKAVIERAVAFDFFRNSGSRLGWQTPSLAETTQYEMVRLSYDYWLLITLYRNHWISRRIVDVPARDMVKAWPRVVSNISPDDITRIERAIRKTQVKTNMLKALQWARLFGGAGALLVIDGHEKDLDRPLDLDDVEPGSFRGVIPFDRWVGVVPEGAVSTNISDPLQFNLPEHYRVQAPQGGAGFRVHSSRILRFLGPGVPTPEYEAQQYWGISVLEPAYEEIRKRDNMSWNILGLTFRAQLIGIQEPNLAQLLSGAGGNSAALQQFYARMQAFNEVLSNQNLVITGKDGGMTTTSYPFTGVGDVYSQFQMDIAGAAEIPVTRLFGRTITGLGQSNDADERIYEEMIAMQQDDHLRPQLERLYEVICASELGEVPDDVDLQFPSVRVLDEKEKSDLAKTTGDNVTALYGANIFGRSMALKELKQSASVTGFGTNIQDSDIEEAEKEDELAKTLGLQAQAGEQEEPEHVEEPEEPRDQQEQGGARAQDGTRTFAGFDVYIEVCSGDRRTIRNDSGEVVYDRRLKHDYGFIKNTLGRDGDEIDCILGPAESAPNVFVVDMRDFGPDPEHREDEDKVLIGFASRGDAVAAFSAMYPRDWARSVKAIAADDYRKALAA